MHPLTQKLIEKINSHIDIINPPQQDYVTEYGASDLANWDKILTIYDMLDDDESKKIFADVIILRIAMMLFPLSTVKKHFSLFPTKEWDRLISEAEKMEGLPGDYILDRVETWILKGYEYKEYKAKPGDIVIEGGCFTGNTTCYFANLVQQQGKVYSFEPNPQIFSQLCENTKKYPQVIPINSGISSHDDTANITNSGVASTVVEKGDISITLRSIDSFVKENNISHVDFIKLDIEGCEQDAIDGAKETIRSNMPTIAICLYHRPNDIFNIPLKLNKLYAGYSFYIKHNSDINYETVLFAIPQKNNRAECGNIYSDDIKIISTFGNIISTILKNKFSYKAINMKDIIVIVTQKLHIYNVIQPIYNTVKKVIRRFK